MPLLLNELPLHSNALSVPSHRDNLQRSLSSLQSRHPLRETLSRHPSRQTLSRDSPRQTLSRHLSRQTLPRDLLRQTLSRHPLRQTFSRHPLWQAFSRPHSPEQTRTYVRSEIAMTSYSRVAAVTGANKGIGLAIVRQLALQYPRSQFNDGPILIYLTARDKSRGEAALESLQADSQLDSAKALLSQGGLADIRFLELDIDSTKSIDEFAAQLKKNHPEGIDFLVNNAGIALNGFDSNVVNTTLHCNYYGTLEATNQLLPHVRDGGRIVNVASTAGSLGSQYSSSIKSRFQNAKAVSEVTELMKEFATAVANNDYRKNWPESAYGVSKAGLISATRILAQENAAKPSKTLINSCCPGWVRTDMSKGRGMKSIDEGAQTPVLLAIGDIKGINGEFWRDERVTKQ